MEFPWHPQERIFGGHELTEWAVHSSRCATKNQYQICIDRWILFLSTLLVKRSLYLIFIIKKLFIFGLEIYSSWLKWLWECVINRFPMLLIWSRFEQTINFIICVAFKVWGVNPKRFSFSEFYKVFLMILSLLFHLDIIPFFYLNIWVKMKLIHD